jgi:hypothetical protein
MPSTVIRSFDYDAGQRSLMVQFVSGRRYTYLAVPKYVFDQMKLSSAKGEFFNAHIRNRFRFERIE